MRINIEEHAQALLEYLGESEEVNVSTFLTENKIDNKHGMLLVEYLVNRGLARDLSTFGGADCWLTGEGLALAQQIRNDRMRPARRLAVLRTRMLEWLENHGQIGDWTDFLASEQVLYYGVDFTKQELEREAVYLNDHELIKAISIDQAKNGMISPSLTARGRDCLIHCEGDVREYLSGGTRFGVTHNTTNNNTTITMTDSVGNITNASAHVIQNVNSGLDTTKVLEFAGAVRQMLPVLGLSQDAQESVGAESQELHEEAEAASPDRGRMRRLLDSILQAISEASATVAQGMITSLGDEALKTITS